MSRVKIAEKKFFFCLFPEFFSIFEQKFFGLWAKKLQKVYKTTFCASRDTFCDFKFFFKSFESFWIFCRNLWYGSQKFIWVSRVKIAEEIVFFVFLFRNFSNFEQKIFRLWPKNFNNLSKLPSTCPEEQIVAWIFLGSESFWIFCRNLRHGSQNSIYVSRVKIAEETVSYFSFQNFFGFWVKNFSDFRPKYFKKLSKLPSVRPQEHFLTLIFFKSFEPFWIFCRNLWYGSQKFI